MSALAATSSSLVPGVDGTFTVKSVLPVAAGSDTMDVTLPANCPKDALPVGPATVFTRADDVYTVDSDIAAPSTHDRSTGVTRYAVGGTVAAGAILVQAYAIVGTR